MAKKTRKLRKKSIGKCLRCDTNIYALEDGSTSGQPDNAMEANIKGYYGSRNDCHEFNAYICDDCIPFVTKFVTNYAYAPGVKRKPLTSKQYQKAVEKSIKEMQKRRLM